MFFQLEMGMVYLIEKEYGLKTANPITIVCQILECGTKEVSIQESIIDFQPIVCCIVIRILAGKVV